MMALVCLPRGECPTCRGPLRRWGWTQPTLLVFGGYGGWCETTFESCDACGVSREIRRATVRPERRR